MSPDHNARDIHRARAAGDFHRALHPQYDVNGALEYQDRDGFGPVPLLRVGDDKDRGNRQSEPCVAW